MRRRLASQPNPFDDISHIAYMAQREQFPLHKLFDDLPALRAVRLEIAYFDPARRLIGDGQFSSDRSGCAHAPFRVILAEVLSTNAASVILAHNHPGGDPTPNPRDYDFTRRLASLLNALGIRIDDHLIVSGDDYFSFREAGLL